MKKLMIMLLAGALAIGTLTACTSGEQTDPSKDDAGTSVEASTEAKTPDMEGLLAALKGKFQATELRERSEDEILMETGIDPSRFVGFFWLAETSGLSSEKAVMYMAKNEDDAAVLKTKLDAVLQSELAQMKDYNADNYAMLSKAVIAQKGVYVYLLVSPNVEEFEKLVNAEF